MPRREFQLVEGSSSKFWAIELDGDSYVVIFGRIGTGGQTREKSFDSAAKAQAEHDKQIAAKVKKGYSEVGGASTPGAPQANKAAAKKATKKKTAAQTTVKKGAASGDSEPEEIEETEVGELQRSVRVSPEERFAVTWEEHEPLKKPAPAVFDLQDCLKRLEKSFDRYYFEWRKTKIPLSPSPEEARFWLLAHARLGKGSESGRDAARVLEKAQLGREMPLKEIVAAYGDANRERGNLFCSVAALLSPTEIVEFMREQSTAHSRSTYVWYTESARSFRKFVLPYLTSDERRAIYDMLEGAIPNPAGALDITIDDHLGAMVGRHSEIAEVVGQFPDGHLGGHLHSYYSSCDTPDWIIFGLGDRASVIAESKRLGLKLITRDAVIAWLALTGVDALDLIAESVSQATNKAEATQLAKPIERVAAPEMAVPALQIATNSKVPQIGQKWLAEHPLEAAVGLALAAKGTGNLAQSAKEHLHTMRRSGKGAFLEAALAHLKSEAADWMRNEILEVDEEQLEDIDFAELPKDLRDALEAVKRAKLPSWLTPSSLPPIKIGRQKLADTEVETLLCAIKATAVTETSPVFDALKDHAEPTSLDNFAWKLFEAWMSMGAVSKEKWAMGGVGHLGGDGCVLNLTPLVRQWPGESQHQRAVFGLQCLRAVNSETALMALNGIALKLKFKALKEKAKVLMEEIANARGMSREELADRIVPDCGLDAQGSREFDFGPRQFQFVLGGESKPMVRDAVGKQRPNLPKPNKSDDPDKSEAALAEWKILKKTLRETLKVQSERLEDAMITGRRWDPESFDKFIVRHPFMVNLARQLVFAAYDDKGKMTQTFRVTEDQSIADQNDGDAVLPSSAGIGVVHPAHLDEPTLSAWGEVLSDYGIIPPFQQLGRTICKPEPGDLKKTEITSFKGPKIPGIVMYGMLERSHWLRDTPADGGGFTQHSKHFPASNVTAFISYDPGLSIGWYDEPQQLVSIYFVPGHIQPEMWGHHKNRVKIGDVDPVVISEVLRLAHAIVARAES